MPRLGWRDVAVWRDARFFSTKSLPIDPYYLGFWLGDGTSANPCELTIGKQDQPRVVPYLRDLARGMDLRLNERPDKLRFSMSVVGSAAQANMKFLTSGFVATVVAACRALTASKKNVNPFKRFQFEFDPYEKYTSRQSEYVCPCGRYTTQNKTLDGRLRQLDRMARDDAAKKQKARQYLFREHMTQRCKLTHSAPTAVDVWKAMSPEELAPIVQDHLPEPDHYTHHDMKPWNLGRFIGMLKYRAQEKL